MRLKGIIFFSFLLCLFTGGAVNNKIYAQPAEKQITIFMLGNSTMADKPYRNGNPEKGWGQVFPLYFNENIKIKNFAVNGRSTKSFIDEGRWETVKKLIKPGDYVFIEFGHNDEKKEDPKRFTDPNTDFKKNLEIFVTETTERGGHPVLITPIYRRKFDASGSPEDTHGLYPGAVKDVASKLKVPLIDLHSKSGALLRKYGAENSKKLYLWVLPGEYDSVKVGLQDDTHFSAVGAFRICDLVVEELKNSFPELAKNLKK